MNKQNKLGILCATIVALSIGSLFAGNGRQSSAPVSTTTAQPATPAPIPVATSPMSGEQLPWQVLSAGGSVGTSTNMTMYSSISQTAAGHGTGGSFKVIQGFWQNFTATGCSSCGDADGSSNIDISDAVFLLQYIFSGGPAPGACGSPTGLGDANGSGNIDISDAVYLVSYIFSGGPTPHCP